MTKMTAAVACLALAILSACGGEAAPAAAASPSSAALQPLSERGFAVRWGIPAVPGTVAAGERFAAAVIVENASDEVWLDRRSAHSSGSGAGAVRLGYRWWSASAADLPITDYGPARGELSGPLPPRGSAVMAMEVTAPAIPGEYRLQLDLCQELVAWFELKGAARLIVPVLVK